MMHCIVIKPDRRAYTGHKKGLIASAKSGDVMEYRKYNKTSNITKYQIFVASGFCFDGKYKAGNYVPEENHFSYSKLNGKDSARKSKLCRVFASG